MKIKIGLFFLITFCFISSVSEAQNFTQWGLPEGAKARLGKGSITDIAYSPDGSQLAVAGSVGIWLYDAETGVEQALLIGHTSDVSSVAFSPDGTTIASGGGGTDETVRLWDADTGELRHTLTGHTDWIRSVAFSPDGTTLATGSGDGTVLLWDLTPVPPEPPRLAADVNGDGSVNIQDLVAVAAALGEMGETAADVNGDGSVNIQDLVAVAAALGEAAGAPPLHGYTDILTRETVQGWLTDAQSLTSTDPVTLRGIAVLQQLLLALTPKETALLANYPNPFNPETWIPYQLANPADVVLHIYTVDGSLVRVLSLGHQGVGLYESKSRAAYWDGKNAQGESVASGVYFYTLTAGDFTATRKMLIRK